MNINKKLYLYPNQHYYLFSFSKLKSELAMLKQRGLLRPNGQLMPSSHAQPYYNPVLNNNNSHHQSNQIQHHPYHTGTGGLIWTTAYQDPARTCGRCRAELGRIMNRGAFCRSCKVRVCKSCREYGRLKGGTGHSNHDWLCTVCHKNM